MAMVEGNGGVRLRTWTSGTSRPGRLPAVLIHGGPGLPDYLGPVASMIDDRCLVHRYDQRGVGGSSWDGDFSIDQSVDDCVSLLDHWKLDQVIMIGHSFGTDLASFVLMDHPDRVAGMIFLAGPFLGTWRDPCHAVERSRRSADQDARLSRLKGLEQRTENEEMEFLTLSWFTDHADADEAWPWARSAAETRSPVNYRMNAQLNADKKSRTLESRVDELRSVMPTGAVIIGGAGDPRPAAALRASGPHLGCDVTIIPGAGHEPWLEAPETFRTLLSDAVERQQRQV